MTTKTIELTFKQVENTNFSVACLGLAREHSANAFNAEMMKEISEAIAEVSKTENIRALVVFGKGKHFSAGADLGWMKDSANLSYEQNIIDAHKLTTMFESLYNLEIPTIAVIRGAAYGGAVGLAACCDIVLCEINAKFCLSEVKLGLLPAVIMPYLAKRIIPGQLKRLSLTARLFSGEEALSYGLADRIFTQENMNMTLVEELNSLLSGGSFAQKLLKDLTKNLQNQITDEKDLTAVAIATARVSAEGQDGLSSFFQKKQPHWACSIPDNTELVQ